MRYIAHQIDRAKWRNTATYRLFPRLQVGIEYNPLADDVHPLANLNILTETRNRPAVIAGTSSDRIGTPEGQSYYVTVSKDVQRWLRLPVAPYAGVAYGTFGHKARPIGGISVRFPAGFSSLVIFDGVKVHPTLTYSKASSAFSLILAHGKDPGLSYSISF